MGFSTVQQQLTQVYMGMDVTFRRDLFEPTVHTTMDQYRELLQEKEEVWIDAYQQRQQTQQPRYVQNNRYNQQAFQRSQYQNTRQQQSQTGQQQQQWSAPVHPPQRQQLSTAQQSDQLCPLHLAKGQRYYHPLEKCRFISDAIDKA